MAFRCLKLLRIIRSSSVIRQHNATSASIVFPKDSNLKPNTYKTEKDLIYLEDPDKFGTLSGKTNLHNNTLEDEGDIKEEQFIQNVPLKSKRLTIKQYADLIKQYLKHKRLKEAIDVLEVRMLKDDRVKPENYIYNLLIGACADVGYTKKAFKLFNDMKRRALKPTGDTYTCLFHACANSPWPLDGLNNAKHLRTLMIEKGIEPNLTNYNSMIKAFGRCGDLPTAFKIVDEMVSKKIKIRVHTLNHLLQACITDKNTGLRHALVVWRKMLKLREKPNIYSFNLMLKCVKDCNLGSKEDIEELIHIIKDYIAIDNKSYKPLEIGSSQTLALSVEENNVTLPVSVPVAESVSDKEIVQKNEEIDKIEPKIHTTVSNLTNKENVTIEIIDNKSKLVPITEQRTVPNLLSKELRMQQVMSLQEVHTVQDKFAVVGGQDDFLKEMEVYSVPPDIKTFTQMLSLIDENRESEMKLIETMKSLEIKADIDFYNMLIKKRCFRSDYDGAFDVKDIIEKESKIRKRKYHYNKKLQLKPNIMTYGVLAMACKTKESAEKLLSEMKDEQIKANIEILGALLRQGTAYTNFNYILYIMNIVKEENVKISDVFIKHLEDFKEKCSDIIRQDEDDKHKCTEGFLKGYKKFLIVYNHWLKEINIEEALKTEHPWKQFRESHPETMQRQNIVIKEPKKFYKRNRKFIPYTPKL